MAIALKSLIDAVAVQLYDESNTNWSEPELLTWLTEALGALAAVRPDLFTQTEVVPLAAGARQDTPATSVRVARVLGTRETETGATRAVTRFDLRSMGAARPGWESDPAGRARQYALAPDADVFYLYPPQPDPPHFGVVEHIVIDDVPEPADAGYDTHEIDLDQRFRRALVDYVLYRTYSKDADVGGQSERATMHYKAFVDGTGVSQG